MVESTGIIVFGLWYLVIAYNYIIYGGMKGPREDNGVVIDVIKIRNEGYQQQSAPPPAEEPPPLPPPVKEPPPPPMEEPPPPSVEEPPPPSLPPQTLEDEQDDLFVPAEYVESEPEVDG